MLEQYNHYADGSSAHSTSSPDGSSSNETYGTDGKKTSDNWQKADGSWGYDNYYADGSSNDWTQFADGGYIGRNDDGLGTVTMEHVEGGTYVSSSVQTPDGYQQVNAVGNQLQSGGAGDDYLYSSMGSTLLIGGGGNDTIATSGATTLIAFNAGDGNDHVATYSGDNNALSLGGHFSLSDLTFQKNGWDLVLNTDSHDSISFTDWYASTDAQKLVNLQIVTEATADYAPNSTDILRNQKIETFDFKTLVNAFDQACSVNPATDSWSLTNALLDAHLSGSNTAALGGDLAYEYGARGSLAGFNIAAAVTTISDGQFAQAPQTVQPWATVNTGVAQLR